MPVVLKSQQAAVVDALRAARHADDELSRIKENSLEAQRVALASLIESSDWKFGPAQLLATFSHHLVCKDGNGNLVQVEWERKDNSYVLGRATVHESATPVADLGHELMETARLTVDLILNEDYETAQPMIGALTEALELGGDLHRRVSNEITLRSLTRSAWWHNEVGDREGIVEKIPHPQTEGEDAVNKSVDCLLIFLKESATEISAVLRALAKSNLTKDVESLASDIAEDTGRAISALMGVHTPEEKVKMYEAVMSTAPRLLNGIEFLKELSKKQEAAN